MAGATWFPMILLPGLGLVLTGCSGPFSTLDPEGPSARSTALLWWIMLTGATVIFVLVSAVLALAWFRPGALGKASPQRLMLWGGVVLPGVVLAALVACALALGERLLDGQNPRTGAEARSGQEARTGDKALAGSGPQHALRVAVTARQWAWEFHYPDHAAKTSDRLHIPAGRDVHFTVTSEDVIHSFWIPRLGGKIDAIPGQTNAIKLRADRPGVYGGMCAEYCGQGHSVMTFTVEAHDAAGFAAQMRALQADGDRARKASR